MNLNILWEIYLMLFDKKMLSNILDKYKYEKNKRVRDKWMKIIEIKGIEE
jgi:hypothetical protein